MVFFGIFRFTIPESYLEVQKIVTNLENGRKVHFLPELLVAETMNPRETNVGNFL